MSVQLTLGVIGHVDHGKTALVKALTGINTDRLKEEQDRGMSIVLGFSYIESASGTIDLVDVPGHEDFIRTMISGATGISGVLLVVDVNEGVMPQTREHFDIVRLLGVDRGIVAIAKSDLADTEQCELAELELREFLYGTFLQDAPVVFTSAVNNEGIDQLAVEIDALVTQPIPPTTRASFYLPIDRVFTMSGFGTVVTGTLRNGVLRTGDEAEVLPGGQHAAIRQLQNHNHAVDAVKPGQRVAVNLRHLKKDDIRTGDTLASPGFLTPAKELDAELTLLADYAQKLKNGETVRLLFGTTEIIAKIRLLNSKRMAPGETELVQFRCRREVATYSGEFFIIRSVSPIRTIGGGRILDPSAIRHRRFDEDVLARLRTTATGTPSELVTQYLRMSAGTACSFDELKSALALDEQTLQDALATAPIAQLGDDLVMDQGVHDQLRGEIVTTIEHYHEEHRTHAGIDIQEVKRELTVATSTQSFDCLIANLAEAGIIESGQSLLRIAGFDPFRNLARNDQQTVAEIEAAFLDGGMAPPALDVVLDGDRNKKNLYRLLSDNKRLVVLKTVERGKPMVFHRKTLRRIVDLLAEHYPNQKEFTVSEARTVLGSTRKYIIPLMEHFDTTGVTIRNGDYRRLREQR